MSDFEVINYENYELGKAKYRVGTILDTGNIVYFVYFVGESAFSDERVETVIRHFMYSEEKEAQSLCETLNNHYIDWLDEQTNIADQLISKFKDSRPEEPEETEKSRFIKFIKFIKRIFV